MAARGQLQKNVVGAKTKFIQILLSHPPLYGDVQVTFSRFFLRFKMAATF